MSSNSRDNNNDREVDPPMSRLFVICNKDNSGNYFFFSYLINIFINFCHSQKKNKKILQNKTLEKVSRSMEILLMSGWLKINEVVKTKVSFT